MKGYFVCDGKDDWWVCYGVLENGFCFGQHVCSHPGFAPGDLYTHRPERQAALKEVFGLSPDDIEWETITVSSKDDVPVWWDEHGKLQDGLKDQYDRYHALLEAAKKPIPDPDPSSLGG